MAYRTMILRGDDGDEIEFPLDAANRSAMPCPHCGKAVNLALTAAEPSVTTYIYDAIERVRHSTPRWLYRMFR